MEDEDLESEDESDIKSLKKAVLAPLDEVLQRRAEDKEEDEEVLKEKNTRKEEALAGMFIKSTLKLVIHIILYFGLLQSSCVVP